MPTSIQTYASTRAAIKDYVDSAGTYPIVGILLAGYVWDEDHDDAADLTDEITTGSVVRTTITNPLGVTTDSTWYFQADDLTFPSCTFTGATGLALISDQGADAASPLICHVALGSINNTAEPYTIAWNGGYILSVSDTVPVDALTAAVLAAIDIIDGGT